MTKANNLTWAIFKDGDRFILGAREWQTCISMTIGLNGATFYSDEVSKKDRPAYMRKLIRRAQITPLARCEELKHTFWTDSRFEQACDDGVFGAAW